MRPTSCRKTERRAGYVLSCWRPTNHDGPCLHIRIERTDNA